ncbi:hypothetical protein FHS42_003113 [Streptomyces zagrosensis]|uniref:Uncharacterized protein n=1 Tax=Streptomyces zagrosensis TaxID=1042984 RepID=A0A7W9UZS2_9ACTN|nr:hypothetical protein [Streptomyces zagrosensis]
MSGEVPVTRRVEVCVRKQELPRPRHELRKAAGVEATHLGPGPRLVAE